MSITNWAYYKKQMDYTMEYRPSFLAGNKCKEYLLSFLNYSDFHFSLEINVNKANNILSFLTIILAFIPHKKECKQSKEYLYHSSLSF